MIEIITKDITTVETGVLINGVNCQNVMGSGVARAYFEKWPFVKEQYHLWHDAEHVLGKFDPVVIEPERLYVANCWTQEFFGADKKVYADTGAILTSVSQAAMFARRRGLDVYAPWVGCGLGGLSTSQVKPILNSVSNVTGCKIYVCELAQ